MASAVDRTPLPSTHSFLHVSPARVFIGALKQAEDGEGYILRLHETHGQACRAEVILDRPIGAACEMDAAEMTVGQPLVPQGARLAVELKPYELKTIRLSL